MEPPISHFFVNCLAQNVVQDRCNLTSLFKAEDNEVGTEERVISVIDIVNSPPPYCFASIWFHSQKYYLSLAWAPQRDSTFVNLRDTEEATTQERGESVKDYANITQIMHIFHKVYNNMRVFSAKGKIVKESIQS